MTAATSEALHLFDSMTDQEFAGVTMTVKPIGITRRSCRRHLVDGSFDTAVFLANLRFVRWLLSDDYDALLAYHRRAKFSVVSGGAS